MGSANGKPLRFAALIRVSTEKQAQKGESLRTQATQLDRAVEALRGKVVTRYAGQEHATAGWERQQLNKLLADAAKKTRPFDAVIVADPSRWSRDNVASETGLQALRDNGVRFFVLGTEYNLFDPHALLFLGLSTQIGAFQARTQNQKSILNRIERAKRGIPTGGKLPYGRIWENGLWRVDPDKLAMIVEVAERYLKGESLTHLAREFRQNHSNLCKILRERCGDKWELTFDAPDLGISERVTMIVPRLLPEKTIHALKHRLEGNRTYLHGNPKHEYLLAGRVFCANCGYSLFGQTNRQGHRYYRHAHTERARKCSLTPRPWVRADAIEWAVARKLFDLRGNPAEIERAVKRATPDADRLLKQRERVAADLGKIEKARNRLLSLIERDAITDAQAESKLLELKDREDVSRTEMDRLAVSLANVPDEAEIRLFTEVEPDGGIFVYDQHGEAHPGGNDLCTWLGMTTEDRQSLIASVFDAPLPDGRPAGVYLTPDGGDYHGPKRFTYVLEGSLLRLNGAVTPRASYSPAPAPPAPRSPAQSGGLPP